MARRYEEKNSRRRTSIDENKEKRMKNDTLKPKKRKKKKIFRKILLTIFVVIILCVFIFAGVLFGVINGTEKLNKDDLTYNNLTTFIYDKDGNEYATLYGEENRMLVSYTDLPKNLPNAFIAIEDQRFETHFGVDIKRTAYAIFTYITNGGSSGFGGSTITQQLVKNITGDDKSSPMRKVREWIRAVQVETWLSKDEIMEMYLNIIFLGDGCYGVQTASYHYFGKDASELTLAECAVLAGITHAPNAYDYDTDEDYKEVKERQEVVLNKMKELGKITQEEYDEAVSQKLEFKSLTVGKASSYIVEAVVDQVIEDIVAEKKTTKAVATKMIYGDGLKIYTNIDPDIQLAMETVYADESYFPYDSGYDERPQSAMVIMENGTGNVVGLVGGAGDKVLRGLNRATQTKRQPGSTIKPIAVYGPGINEKTITSSTVYDDVPTTIGGWTIGNWGGGYAGLSSARKGIEKSMNIVAVKALQDVGISTAYTYLQKLGITTLVDSDQALTLALGGIKYGILPIEMCGAYSTIANGGKYIEPSLYKKVIDKKGNIVLEDKQATRQVFSEQAAYIVQDMMRDVVRGSNGTATYVNVGGNPIAAKTGSTDDNKDRWFCGITPYYTASVWVGFDEPKRVRISGQNPAGKIWNAVMKQAHKGLAVKNFVKPSGISTVNICMDSGKLATDLCAQDQRGTRVRSDLFITGTVPSKYCEVHVAETVCAETNLIACPGCEAVTRVFIKRAVIPSTVASAADYQYELPTLSCDKHANILPDPDIEDPTEIIDPNTQIDDEENPYEEEKVDTGPNGYM